MSNITTEGLPKMEYVRLGNTGMRVSRLCLGCMSYGSSTYAQIVMAWQFTKPYVSSPTIGASKIEQLHELVRSLSIKLTDEEVKYL